MFRLARGIGLLAVLGLSAGVAHAVVPSPANSTWPLAIQMVPGSPSDTTTGGNVINGIGGSATFVIRDGSASPLPNATITINITNCRGQDLRFANPQPDNNADINCATGIITLTPTGANGQKSVYIVGYAVNSPAGSAGRISGCATATVTVPGQAPVNYPNINFAAPDQNGAGGVNAADAALFLVDRDSAGSPKNQARSDFNGSGLVNPADGAIMLFYRDVSGFNTSWGGPVCVP